MAAEGRSSPGRSAPTDADVGSITSVTKALHLLDCFRLKDVPMGVTELARLTGLPKSTAFRLLTHLEEIGYVERHGRKYRPGWLLFELGTGVDAVKPRGLRTSALPHMADLFALTGQTVHLGALHGAEIIHVARMRGSKSAVSPIRYGGRAPAACSAMGKILLADLSRQEIEQVLAGRLPRMTPYSIMTPGVLVRQLKEAKERGYALEREETALGLVSVAVAIRHGNRSVGALALVGYAGLFDEAKHLAPLRRSADRIEKALDDPANRLP